MFGQDKDRNAHPVPYVTCDPPLVMIHHFLDDPAIDKWHKRDYVLTSVSPLILSSPPCLLLYLDPPWNCMFTPPTPASQWTLLTDRCLLVSFPSFTTEVTATLNTAMLNVPPLCLKNSQNKQSQCTSVLGRHVCMQPTPYTASMIKSLAEWLYKKSNIFYFCVCWWRYGFKKRCKTHLFKPIWDLRTNHCVVPCWSFRTVLLEVINCWSLSILLTLANPSN